MDGEFDLGIWGFGIGRFADWQICGLADLHIDGFADLRRSELEFGIWSLGFGVWDLGIWGFAFHSTSFRKVKLILGS